MVSPALQWLLEPLEVIFHAPFSTGHLNCWSNQVFAPRLVYPPTCMDLPTVWLSSFIFLDSYANMYIWFFSKIKLREWPEIQNKLELNVRKQLLHFTNFVYSSIIKKGSGRASLHGSTALHNECHSHYAFLLLCEIPTLLEPSTTPSPLSHYIPTPCLSILQALHDPYTFLSPQFLIFFYRTLTFLSFCTPIWNQAATFCIFPTTSAHFLN